MIKIGVLDQQVHFFRRWHAALSWFQFDKSEGRMAEGQKDAERVIEFWFDFSSPYAYFASFQIEDFAGRHGRIVSWNPFLLGAAFKTTGMQPLTRMPLRGAYANHDWERLARLLRVPFVMPPNHPALTVAAGRTFLWLEREHNNIAVPFARKVFMKHFGDGIDISDKDVVIGAAVGCGAERVALVKALASTELKEQFRQKNDEAIERGIFGSPFFVTDGEAFWGADRLPMMDEWLRRGGW